MFVVRPTSDSAASPLEDESLDLNLDEAFLGDDTHHDEAEQEAVAAVPVQEAPAQFVEGSIPSVLYLLKKVSQDCYASRAPHHILVPHLWVQE